MREVLPHLVLAFPGSGGSPLVTAVAWINDLLLGSLAVGLCVLAVALVGLMMFEGRLPVRHGARVILGCFILLGAPVIASGFAEFWQDESVGPPLAPAPDERLRPREPLPQSDYDPYAGASLRRD